MCKLQGSHVGPPVDAGGWSLLNGSNNSVFDINGSSFLQQKMKSSPALFSVSVMVDDKNSSVYSLEVCDAFTVHTCT